MADPEVADLRDEGKVAQPVGELEPDPDGPDFSGFHRWLLAEQLAFVPRVAATFDGIHVTLPWVEGRHMLIHALNQDPLHVIQADVVLSPVIQPGGAYRIVLGHALSNDVTHRVGDNPAILPQNMKQLMNVQTGSITMRKA